MLILSRYVLAILLFGPPVQDAGAETKDAAVKEFNQQVKQYADLHKKIDNSLPKLKQEEDPNVILQREKEFATAIRAARPSPQQGDIFVPAVRPVIREIIRQETTGLKGKKARAIILGEGNPKAKDDEGSEVVVKLVVNGPYPSAAPLSSVPPALLLRLPPLPDAVEYRFVGRSLILWDTKANLIVDFLTEAIT